jgi:hypothetical protein
VRVSYDGKTVDYRSDAEIDRVIEALDRVILVAQGRLRELVVTNGYPANACEAFAANMVGDGFKPCSLIGVRCPEAISWMSLEASTRAYAIASLRVCPKLSLFGRLRPDRAIWARALHPLTYRLPRNRRSRDAGVAPRYKYSLEALRRDIFGRQTEALISAMVAIDTNYPKGDCRWLLKPVRKTECNS